VAYLIIPSRLGRLRIKHGANFLYWSVPSFWKASQLNWCLPYLTICDSKWSRGPNMKAGSRKPKGTEITPTPPFPSLESQNGMWCGGRDEKDPWGARNSQGFMVRSWHLWIRLLKSWPAACLISEQWIASRASKRMGCQHSTVINQLPIGCSSHQHVPRYEFRAVLQRSRKCDPVLSHGSLQVASWAGWETQYRHLKLWSIHRHYNLPGLFEWIYILVTSVPFITR